MIDVRNLDTPGLIASLNTNPDNDTRAAILKELRARGIRVA